MIKMKKIITINIVLILSLLAFASAAHADTEEYYYHPSDTDYLLRRVYKTGGDIYEYMQDDAYRLTTHYGRIGLLYKASEGKYYSYDWDLNPAQVTLTEYTGTYSPSAPNSIIRSGIVTSEMRIDYIYDHHGIVLNLDTATNGWTLRQKRIFENDAITLREQYVHDASGRLTREDYVPANRYYNYTYYGADMNARYKYEYERSTNTLLNTYELIANDFYIKKTLLQERFTATRS